MTAALISLATSFTFGLFLYIFRSGLLRMIARKDLGARQSAHSLPTLRLGGLCLLFGVAASGFYIAPASWVGVAWTGLFIGASLIFAVGLLEDIGYAVRPRTRLAAAVLASLLSIGISGISVPPVGIPGIDTLWLVPGFGAAFTALALSGVSNGFNLIDGLNGLFAVAALGANGALWYIAVHSGVDDLAPLHVVLAGALLGFVLLNYPFGKLFMGDAGAYTVGFFMAWAAVFLVTQNSAVSPYALVLACFWPVADTLHAIFRRFASGRLASQPDRMHFHHLVMRTIEIRLLGRRARSMVNPLATLIMAPVILTPPFLGGLFWNDRHISLMLLIGSFSAFILGYRSLAVAASRRSAGKRSRIQVTGVIPANAHMTTPPKV